MATEFSYRNYFENDSKVMAVYGGIWPDNITDRSQKIFKVLWMLSIILVVVPLNVFLISYVVVHIKSVSEVVDGYLTFAIVILTVKFYYIVRKRKEVEQLYTTVFTEEDFRPKNEEEERIAVEVLLLYRILKYAFVIVAQFALLLFMFSDVEKTGYLPMMSWYPVDVSVSPLHEIAFIHQFVATVVLANAVVISEIVMVGFTSFIALQCDLICHRLENLESDDHKTLIEIIEVHKKALSFVEKLETTFGSGYFAQFLVMVIVIAMFLLVLTQETTSTLQSIALLTYFILAYLAILSPCWFTSELTRRSELIARTAFNCSWVDSPNSFKKDLIYFMQMSQKPMTISIFGFFPISLQTATKIIQTSFSYYTMLKKLNK